MGGEKMTDEELKKKAEEYQTGRKDLNYFSEPYKDKIRKAYIAGAKEMQKENEQLKQLLEKLKHCDSCKHSCYLSQSSYALICKFSNYFCGKACDKWKLKE